MAIGPDCLDGRRYGTSLHEKGNVLVDRCKSSKMEIARKPSALLEKVKRFRIHAVCYGIQATHLLAPLDPKSFRSVGASQLDSDLTQVVHSMSHLASLHVSKIDLTACLNRSVALREEILHSRSHRAFG